MAELQDKNLTIGEGLDGHESNHHDHDHSNQRIIKGFEHFLQHEFWKYPEKFKQLAKSQHPKFLVFSCSDSRVCPSHILDFQLGEAFMARNIASLVPAFDQVKYKDAGAIIEYAVHVLKVENILVIGHSCCGGIQRLMSHPEDCSPPFDFIDEWVNIALPAKIKVKSEFGTLPLDKQYAICTKEAVNLSLRNLQTYPYVQRAIAEGKLSLKGGYYDFVEGAFLLWEMKCNITRPIIIN